MKLIIIDGENGVGKSTIISKLDNCVKCHAPGFTEAGAYIRKIVRGTDVKPLTNVEAITHCMIADRLESFNCLYNKYKNSNTVIVTDRWMISTIAYQAIAIDDQVSGFIYNLIMTSVSNEEKDCICDPMYHITCDPELVTGRLISERQCNTDHGFDQFMSLQAEEQRKLKEKFNFAFSSVSQSLDKKNITLVNNNEDDLEKCVSTIQEHIDSLL